MEEKNLKLNYKNTLFIGCAFFSILMLWQVYNHYCPLFLDYLLREHTSLELDGNERLYIIGIIMAADNLFAVFMLPLFGTLSDKTHSRFGRRMPYIFAGMILSAIVFPLIPIFFMKNNIVALIVTMGAILLIMNMYRNPAVALMPDVTPKPLRSQANGIINFVGYLGAIIAGALAMVLKISGNTKGEWAPTQSGYTNGIIAFCIASAFMLIALVLLCVKIKENKLVEENAEALELGEQLSETHEDVSKTDKLSKADRRNIVILLISIFLWYMAFNAIETFNSLFCKDVLNNEGAGGTVVIVMTISSIITFLASMNLPVKLGRKKCVSLGLMGLAVGFIIILAHLLLNGVFAADYDSSTASISIIPIYIAVIFAGIGWALINANSYPMLVEMSNKNNVGRFTGLYYTFGMVAQSVTPILIGIIMSLKGTGLRVLYVYSFVLVAVAVVVFNLFKENRKTIEIKKGFAALDVDD